MIQQMNKIIYILLIMLCTSCALTYETQKPKCELMQRGEPCLSNHACCETSYNYNHTPHWSWWYWNKPYYNKTNYIIVNKPNKPNKPNIRPNKPNNKPNKNRRHRK